jgi:hypothetical protein
MTYFYAWNKTEVKLLNLYLFNVSLKHIKFYHELYRSCFKIFIKSRSKVTTTNNWNIVESGIKHYNPNLKCIEITQMQRVFNLCVKLKMITFTNLHLDMNGLYNSYSRIPPPSPPPPKKRKKRKKEITINTTSCLAICIRLLNNIMDASIREFV